MLFFVCCLQLKGILLTQETKTFTKAHNLQIAQNPENHYEQIEEHTVDCPDCFDTMVKIYDSDRIRYYCENCDLIIPAIEVYGFIR
jgi:formamidopyrimidine-DNA glycosylase